MVSFMLKDRRSRLIPFFESTKTDAILITNLKNIRYFSGFSGSDGILLLTPQKGWFLCDSRYTTQAQKEVQEIEIRTFSAKYEALCSLITEEKFERIACEGDHLVVADFIQLSKKLSDSALVAFEDSLAVVRSCKCQLEIEQLRQVAKLSSQAFIKTLPQLKPGISEKEFARELEFEMRRNGADGIAFDFIVASGKRSSMPHGVASDKLIQNGELVTIDFGALKNAYHSDETVTVAVGKPSQELIRIHQIVKDAHDKAIDAIKPGISCRDLDSIARKHINKNGYEKFFGHGLGHGVGLDIHEKPTISPRSTAIVEEGMVFTIEPGIYLPEIGGVRIEDTIVVTATGMEIITNTPKELLFL